MSHFKIIVLLASFVALAGCPSTQSVPDPEPTSDIGGDSGANTDGLDPSGSGPEGNLPEDDYAELANVIYFDFDSSEVRAMDTDTVSGHAAMMSGNMRVSVRLEGHADERGTPEYNIALGERRAKAVANYLENMGVSSSQITIVSYGEEKPMVKDRTEAAFAKNRRAVLVY